MCGEREENKGKVPNSVNCALKMKKGKSGLPVNAGAETEQRKGDCFVGSRTFTRLYDGCFPCGGIRAESECDRRFHVSGFEKWKCRDDKSLYL